MIRRRFTNAHVGSASTFRELALSFPDDDLQSIARILTAAKLPHALIGGHAVNAFLPPRFTADIDITVQHSQDALARMRIALEQAGYRMTTEDGVGFPSGPDFIRYCRSQSDPPIELQAAKTQFQKIVIDRAVVSKTGLSVATVEDLIVLKLIANRPKDRADLAGLLNVPDVDWEHVEHWAREWEVLKLLARLREA